MVVDQNMSVLEGSIGIFPRRILVEEDDNSARRGVCSRTPASPDEIRRDGR